MPEQLFCRVGERPSKVVKTIKAGQYPSAIAIAPDGKTAYVVSRQGVVPIHTATNKPGKAIKTGAYLTAIAITPNGRTVYVAGYDTALGAGTVTPIHRHQPPQASRSL